MIISTLVGDRGLCMRETSDFYCIESFGLVFGTVHAVSVNSKYRWVNPISITVVVLCRWLWGCRNSLYSSVSLCLDHQSKLSNPFGVIFEWLNTLMLHDFWPFQYFAVRSEIRGEQIFVVLESHEKELLSISNVLPLDQLLDHLCIEEMFNCLCVHLVIVFAFRKHTSYQVQVLYCLFTRQVELSLPAFTLIRKIMIFLLNFLIHPTNLGLVSR